MNTIRLAALVVLATAGLTVAEPYGHRMDEDSGGRNHQQRMEKISRELGLTTQQQDELRNLRAESMDEMKGLREALQDARKTTQELILSDQASDDEIMKSVVAEGAAYLALSKARAEHQLKVRKIVGAENAAKLIDMRNDWRMKHGRGEPRD